MVQQGRAEWSRGGGGFRRTLLLSHVRPSRPALPGVLPSPPPAGAAPHGEKPAVDWKSRSLSTGPGGRCCCACPGPGRRGLYGGRSRAGEDESGRSQGGAGREEGGPPPAPPDFSASGDGPVTASRTGHSRAARLSDGAEAGGAHTGTHTHTHTCVHAHMCAHTHTHTGTHTHKGAHARAHTGAHSHRHACTHPCAHTGMHMHAHTRAHAHARTHSRQCSRHSHLRQWFSA